jgi:hypothetical protein
MSAAAAAAGAPQVAADPNTLYPLLIDSPAVATLAGLLSHDNTDIAVEVMDLLQELTDAGGDRLWSCGGCLEMIYHLLRAQE